MSAPRVHRVAAHLLGGHVADRADDLAFGGVGRELGVGDVEGIHLGELGEAEVEDLEPAVPRHEEIGGLEVAVDDASLVGGGEAASGLLRVLARLAGRQGPAARTSRSERPSRSSVTR